MAKAAKKGGEGEPTFEAALQRLEEIVELLENGSASLDETMRMYAEGIELSKMCLERLSQAELQLKRLTKDASGKFELLDEKIDE
jgi:exodeoxyribonuclease VII small subunit